MRTMAYRLAADRGWGPC